MSTKNFVPRANNEGGIGTEAKQWGSVWSKNIYVDGTNVKNTLTTLEQNIGTLNIAAATKATTFNSVAIMKEAHLEPGMVAMTTGYHNPNDGGAGVYNIRAKTPYDVDDGGSVLFLDNENVAELIADNSVDVLQFGAKCDGTTDDSSALQKCVNYAQTNGKTVIISRTMLVDSTITVGDRVNIVSPYSNGYRPRIIAGQNCAKLFDCVGVQNRFEGLRIRNYQSAYRNFVGFDFHGNAQYDIDTDVIDCYVMFADKGAIVRGRNVKFLNSGFTHCRYGISYEFPSGASQIRGCQIDNCRFHGIGEEEDLKFVDCSAVYVGDTNGSFDANITIRNCICDQGCTLFDGYTTNLLLEGNFIESYEGPLLNLHANSFTNMVSCKIIGNTFKGKDGGMPWGETAGRPDNMVLLSNVGRVEFSQNTICYCEYAPVVLDGVKFSSFEENIFYNISRSDASQRYAYMLTGCSDIKIANNFDASDVAGTNGICKSADNSSANIENNARFTVASGVVISRSRKYYYPMYSGTTGTETTLKLADLPNSVFLVRRTDSATAWMVEKNDSYLAMSPKLNAGATNIDYLTHTVSADGYITFNVNRCVIATNTYSTLSVPFVIEIPY